MVVDRGGYYSETYGHARVVRSASRVDRRLSNVNPGIGFPVNGVVLRGGEASLTITSVVAWRCGRRYGYKNVGPTYTGRMIGFRLNGVIRGGGFMSGQDGFVRCGGYRSGDYSRNVVRNWLGFLCEWCI